MKLKRGKIESMRSAVTSVRQAHIRNKTSYTLSPTCTFILVWDVLILFLLLYWLCTLPVRTAMLEFTPLNKVTAWVITDYVFDSFLWADVLLRSSALAYYEKDALGEP